MARHVLVLIHGITTDEEPDVTQQYQRLVAAVRERGLPIHGEICQVSWGSPGTDGKISRPDQYLSKAQSFVAALLAQGPKPYQTGSEGTDRGIPGLRSAIQYVRKSVVQFGLSDALYYASPEGEQAVREAIFDQVFGKLERSDNGEVHLHIVAHSLGVTVAHDFLYALFGEQDPDFPSQSDASDPYALDKATISLRDKWRDEARHKRLKLGTFISFASQLPLFVMRKQALVERLARKERLDPSVIGIDIARERPQWAIFHDEDELLGFATAALYTPTRAIVDIRTNTGVDPATAHLAYWKRERIIERCLSLLAANMA